MNKNKGFTLIELLVVIAIIGILAGLIIVSLGDATNSAKEARIKSALDQLRPVAQLHKNTNGNYGGLTTNSKVISIYDDVVSNGGQQYTGGAVTDFSAIGDFIDVADTAYCAYAVTPMNTCMCVDSQGHVVESSTLSECVCATQACP